jgi:hypothetical protein
MTISYIWFWRYWITGRVIVFGGGHHDIFICYLLVRLNAGTVHTTEPELIVV